jgi:hypothetical protein
MSMRRGKQKRKRNKVLNLYQRHQVTCENILVTVTYEVDEHEKVQISD